MTCSIMDRHFPMVPTQERKIHPGALRKLAEESLGGQVDGRKKGRTTDDKYTSKTYKNTQALFVGGYISYIFITLIYFGHKVLELSCFGVLMPL